MNMYYIAIVAPEEINKEVLKWKNFMKERFGCVVALRSPAHITLVPPFWMDPGLEKELASEIEAFSKTEQSFDLELKDFSSFPPRVVFVNPLPSSRLTEIQESLMKRLMAAKKFPLEKDERAYHPHLTIATRDLYKRAYYEAWEVFSKKEYHANWKVLGISLLRNNNKIWEVVFNSEFKN